MYAGAMAFVLTVLLIAENAVAQQHATDRELHAAYCQGTLTQVLNSSTPFTDPGVPAAMRQRLEVERQKMMADIAERRQKYTQYLFSTGAVGAPDRGNTMFGISLAFSRGEADFLHCAATSKQCSETYLGKYGEPMHNDDKSLQFDMACVNSDKTCSKYYVCISEDDGLPF